MWGSLAHFPIDLDSVPFHGNSEGRRLLGCRVRNGLVFAICAAFSAGLLLLTAVPATAQVYPSTFQGQRDIHGFVNTIYRTRNIEGESDQDFYQYWNIEAEELVPGRASGAFSLRLNTDLDGRVDGAPGLGTYVFDRDPFYSVDDARNDREYVDLYTGYIDLYNGTPDNGYLRIGRQYLQEWDYIHADAVKLELPVSSAVKLKGFFGQAVSFYSGHTNDWTGGVGVEIAPSYGNRWWFGYDKYADDIADNDSYTAETWQSPWEGAWFHARFRGLDDEARDLDLNLSQYFTPLDLTLFVDVHRLFSKLEDESRHHSPFYRTDLLEEQPYTSYSFRFDKALPCNFGLSGGFGIRRVSENEQDYGNRDWEHGDVTLSFYPTNTWYYSISAEWWNTDPDSSFFGYSGEIGYRPNKCIDWTLGSSYGNYVFRYEDERFPGLYRESPFIKTYYTGLRWRVNETNNLRINFEIEDDDRGEDYYSLRLNWGQTF